jgi:hypothetical protein
MISQNMAYNLRLRQEDKVKLVVLEKSFEEESASERSGDLLLLQRQPSPIPSITFSPVEDSLVALTALEGGDTIADVEIQARFVTPYLEGCENAVLKKGHLLVLRDGSGKRLEFYISHIATEETVATDSPDENIEGKAASNKRSLFSCIDVLNSSHL